MIFFRTMIVFKKIKAKFYFLEQDDSSYDLGPFLDGCWIYLSARVAIVVMSHRKFTYVFFFLIAEKYYPDRFSTVVCLSLTCQQNRIFNYFRSGANFRLRQSLCLKKDLFEIFFWFVFQRAALFNMNNNYAVKPF